MEKQKISYIKILLLLAAIAFVIYSNSFSNQFVWDDQYLVENNSFIRDWRQLPQLFTTELYDFAPASQQNYYRPIQSLSYMFDYSLWQLNVFGYHLTNLILHILNALLVFSLINLIVKDKRISLATSLLFIVHPIHTEAVTYISGRADLLAGFFLLVSFILFIKYSHYPVPKRNLYYTTSVISFLLALLSKESAIIFPITLLVYEHCFSARAEPLTINNRIRHRYLPFLVVAGAYALLRVTMLNFTGRLIVSRSINLYLRLLTMCKSIFAYLGVLIMPLNLHMERRLAVAGSFFEPQVLICVLLVSTVTVIVWLYRTRQRAIYFALLWFLVTLLPQSSLFFPEIIAEHFLYLPSIGLFLILALFFSKFKRYSKLIFFPLLIFYSTLTWGQNINWKDPATFYRWTLKCAPNSVSIRNNLAMLYEDKGLIGRAIYEYKRTLEIHPGYMYAHNNLGNTYLEMELFDLAIREYQEALKSRPDSSLINRNLLFACESAMEKILKNNPRTPIDDNLIALCEIAIDAYRKELKANPDFDVLHYNLGVWYSRRGLTREAVSEYKKTLEINPEFSEACFNLGAIYAREGRLEEAIGMWERVLAIDPEFEKARSSIKKARKIKRANQ